MEIAQKRKDQLERIKKNVEKSYQYFQSNYRRWHDSKNFIFITTLSEAEKNILTMLGKPQLEFNIVEPYISRLCGEFFKQEPSIEVSAKEEGKTDPKLIDIVEGYVRYIEYESRHNGFATEVFKDTTGGGFGVAKVYTEYEHPKSFKQIIKLERRDPTMCGFDPLAQLKTKADGRYCFEVFPKTKEEFEIEYPNIAIDKINFIRTESGGSIQGFQWSYKNEKEDILLVVDYYEKKKKKIKIVKLASGHTLTKDQYDEFMQQWEEGAYIEQAPAIIEERMTSLDTICRYRLIEDQVIEYVETDYPGLPYVFFDGNSVTVKERNSGPVSQYTRCLIHNARDIQRLKNFAGQTLAGQLEGMVNHKFKVPKEGIPKEYKEAYENVQKADILIYNQFKNDDPNVRLDPPMEIQQQPILPEVTNTFTLADQMTQNILGSYEASLGINNNNVSGRAIEMGAMQSNAASMPYIMNYLEGYNRVSELIVGLLPKYYMNQQSLPIINKEGENASEQVNKPGYPSINYEQEDIQVKVEAGVNFSVQKNLSLQFLMGWLQSAPESEFSQFINSKGTPVILKNLEIHGSDQLTALYQQWQQEKGQMAQQQQQMQQQMMQNDPQYIRAQTEKDKLMLEAKEVDMNNKIEVAKLALEKEALDTERMKLLSEVQESERQRLMQQERDQTERIGQAVDLAIKAANLKQKTRLQEED